MAKIRQLQRTLNEQVLDMNVPEEPVCGWYSYYWSYRCTHYNC